MTAVNSNRLPILAAEIRTAHRAALTATQTAVERAREAGTRLIEAKGLLPHGRWLPWLREIGISSRTAQDYMRLARMPADKYAGSAHLGIHKALGTLAGLSGNNEWYTPPGWIERVRCVLGAIDCDPASNEVAQQIVQAAEWCDRSTDGLKAQWRGNVWLNPPYSRGLIDDFIEKLIVERGHIDQAIVLVHNQTDANWFHRLCSIASAVAFTRGRIGFYNAGVECSSPTTGSVFCYIGDATERFHDNFQDDCLVLRSRGNGGGQ